MSETSPHTPSALPDAWIERLFGRLSCLYGAKFADLWAGVDVVEVKRTWGRKLVGFDLGVIKAAIEACEDSEKGAPPTLPEFVALCRDAARRLQPTTLALPPVELTAEQIEANRQKLRAVTQRTSTDNGSLLWAEKLRAKFLRGERLRPIQIELASNALGEEWSADGVTKAPICTPKHIAVRAA